MKYEMKAIGLIGGMSWESSALYYKLINEGVRNRLGGLHSAEIILASVDFAVMEELQRRGEWDAAAAILLKRARALESAGADFLLLCTNTMHIVADQIQAAIGIPFVHIADATGKEIRLKGLQKVALLGTRFTMEKSFYVGRLQEQFGIEVITPSLEARKMIHEVIYDELCQGQINPASKKMYSKVIAAAIADGAEGVILGCTEIGLLISQADTEVPLFDTTQIHAKCAVDLAIC